MVVIYTMKNASKEDAETLLEGLDVIGKMLRYHLGEGTKEEYLEAKGRLGGVRQKLEDLANKKGGSKAAS